MFSGVCDSYGMDTALSRGTTVTSGSAHSVGSWVQLTPAGGLPRDANGIALTLTSDTRTRAMFDIAVGATGSEIVVVEKLYHGGGQEIRNGETFYLPLTLGKGSDVSVRAQSRLSSADFWVTIQAFSDGPEQDLLTRRVDALGTVLASTSGTIVDPGGTANQLGGWVEVVNSTARPYRALMAAFGIGDTTTTPNGKTLVELGIGASPNEVIIVQGISMAAELNRDSWMPSFFHLPIAVPANSALSARSQSTDIAVGKREVDVVLYGVT